MDNFSNLEHQRSLSRSAITDDNERNWLGDHYKRSQDVMSVQAYASDDSLSESGDGENFTNFMKSKLENMPKENFGIDTYLQKWDREIRD